MTLLVSIAKQIFNPDCVDKFLDYNFEPFCIQNTISKCLGMGIVAGASVVKVPQILRILRERSVVGLSLSMFLLEVIGYTISAAYSIRNGYPFSTYGENIFLWLQSLLIVYLILTMTKKPMVLVASLLVGLLGFAYALLDESLVPMQSDPNTGLALSLSLLQRMSIAIFVLSRLPQIISIFMQRHTGALSFVTVFLNAAGSGARVFTTISEISDPNALLGVVLSAAMNAIILLQMLIFWSNTQKFMARLKEQQSSNVTAKEPKSSEVASKPAAEESTTASASKNLKKRSKRDQ